jgi:branched-chain amino acid transport system substrate-binding protein
MFAKALFPPGVLAAAMLASGAALAQISDDVVKIGVLTDMNGPASTPTGQGSVTAAQMAIDDFGGKVLGKPISVVVGDHQLKPDIGSAIARRWYDVEQVDLIVDAGVGRRPRGAECRQRKEETVHHPSDRRGGFSRQFCSPIRCNGCSTPVRLPSAPRRRWSSAVAIVGLHHRRLRSGIRWNAMPRP